MSESFWDFSVRAYRTDNVAEVCLSLQDEHNVDVNMLLFCCWFAVTRGLHETSSFESVFEFSRSWASQVVRPLRQVRTWMKLYGCHDPRIPTESCMEFREKVKGIELTAEKMQQDVLESIVVAIPIRELSLSEQLDATVKNINQYFTLANIARDELVSDKLLTVIKVGVTDFSIEDIQNTIKNNF